MSPYWSALLTLPHLQFAVSLLTLAVAAIGGIVAYRSFRRTEKWKKAEFLAGTMKDFFNDDRVQKTKLFIDWEVRTIQLFPTTEPDEGSIVVTRLLQAKALRPHCISRNVLGEDEEALIEQVGSDPIHHYTRAEVVIRDCYEKFLDGLETLASYAKTDLVDVASMTPYIEYWMEEMQSRSGSKTDASRRAAAAAWRAALLTYITFYRYKGVLSLFEAFGYDVRVTGDTYRELLTMMENQRFAAALAMSVEVQFPFLRDSATPVSAKV
jgi:hypothetical protein